MLENLMVIKITPIVFSRVKYMFLISIKSWVFKICP